MATEKTQSDENCSYVCKFRRIDERLLKLLSDREIYIPTVAGVNDPLEGIFTEGLLFRNTFAPTKEVFFDNAPQATEDMKTYLQTAGVYCVSEHKKKWHSSNFLPMWASYADDHSGVCLVFKRKPLTDARFKWVKVEYVTHPHNHKDSRLQTLKPPQFSSDLFGTAQAKLAKKYDYWEYVRELRLVAQPECTGHQPLDKFFDLHAVVFGFKAKKENILKVLNQLPDDFKQTLLNSADRGIFQVIKPNSLFMYESLKDFRPLLRLKPKLSFEWGAE